MSLRFDPEPYDVVDEIFERESAGDRSAAHLADRLDHWFGELEKDPRPESTRRRRLRTPGLWMITIPRTGEQDDWAILWDISHVTAWVRYVGPASFA